MSEQPVPATRYATHVEETMRAVLQSGGVTDKAIRQAAFERRLDALPPELRTFVDKVRLQAWQVSDDDVAALKAAGHSEDAIFEVTAAAALGAAIMRLQRGLDVLHAAE